MLFEDFQIGVEITRKEIDIFEEPGTEGWFDGFKNIKIFQPDILFNEESGMIEIHNLNFKQLYNRVKNIYSEKNLYVLFNVIYNEGDWKKYKANKMEKSAMRQKWLEFEPFFALEVMLLFDALYKRYGLSYYKKIADWLYQNTWISKEANTKTKIDGNYLTEIRPNFRLKDYQLEFIKSYPDLKDKHFLDGYLLSFDQGLGKSLTSIALSLVLNCDLVVIVCPNSLKGNWENEIKSYLTKYDDLKTFQNEVYAIRESKHRCNIQTVKYLIVNHESIKALYDYLPKGRKNPMIILDESHYFRNVESKRSKELVELKRFLKCKNNLMMSGTPIKALPNEMVPVMQMIDPLFTDSVAVKYTKIFNVKGLSTSELVKNRFSRIMHRKTKDEVLKLPPIEEEVVSLTLSNSRPFYVETVSNQVMDLFSKIMEQEQPEYNKYRNEFTTQLKEIVEKNPKIDRTAYSEYLEFLRVFDSGKDVSEKYNEITLEKLNSFTKLWIYPTFKDPKERDRFKFNETRYLRLKASCLGRALGAILPKARTNMYISLWDEHKDKFIEMIQNNEKKTIIFTSLLGVAKHIANDLENSGVGATLIVGATKNRTEEIGRFKYDDNIQVLVATTQTLSTGANFQHVSNMMFFFAKPWRSADYEQAKARIHRMGQTLPCKVYDLTLDTGKTPNLATRIDKILNWSDQMFKGFINHESLKDHTDS